MYRCYQAQYLADRVDLVGGDGQARIVLQQEHRVLDHRDIILCRGVQAGGRAIPAHVIQLRNLIQVKARLLGWQAH